MFYGSLQNRLAHAIVGWQRAFVTPLAIAVSILAPSWAIAETLSQMPLPDQAAPELASNLPNNPGSAKDLGGTIFPEYYRSPFGLWRGGSDAPASLDVKLPPGSREDFIELRTSPKVLVEGFPELSPYPIIRPFDQPAANQIRLIESR
jgi:hypothetical protein